MANELYVKLEPYIEVDNIYIEVISNERFCCGVDHYDSDIKFCPKCGKEIILSECKYNEIIDHYSFIDEHNEDNMLLHKYEDKTIIVSNYTKCFISIEHIYTDAKVWEISDNLKNEMINQFLDIHKEDISKIEKFVGKKVDIKFGITAYWG